MYSEGIDSPQSHIYLVARNPHSRPVTVSSFGVIYATPRFPLGLRSSRLRLWFRPNDISQFPFQIDGGRSLTQYHTLAAYFQRARENGVEPRNLAQVWFLTSSGKYFNGKVDHQVAHSLQKQFEVQSPIDAQ